MFIFIQINLTTAYTFLQIPIARNPTTRGTLQSKETVVYSAQLDIADLIGVIEDC